MWRSIERASLEKKPSIRLSHDPCVGVNGKVKGRWAAQRASSWSRARYGRNGCRNDLDRSVGRVGGVEEVEKFK
jgi:hypothetical protein